MAVDYDLVILGGTAYARDAALQATSYGARIALIEPFGLYEQNQTQKYLLYALRQLGETMQRQKVGTYFGLTNSGQLNWSQVLAWARIAATTQQPYLSAEALSLKGIDVILEAPERLSRNLAVTTENRRLTTRGVLAAFGHLPTFIEGLQTASLPDLVSLASGSLETISWALALHHCGVRVNLITNNVLPNHDLDIRRLVRSHLTASGISISPKPQPDQVLVQSPRPVIELPRFITLKTNRRMQTNHPRVFACGSILGGVEGDAIAHQEADIAIRNALFLPRNTINYETTAYGETWLSVIGLTEAQARRRYGSAVQTFVATSANATYLSHESPLPSYRKLVFVGDRLLGAHILGENVDVTMKALVSNINKNVALSDLKSQIVQFSIEAPSSVQRSSWQIGQWRRGWAENWFNWRRSR